MMFQHDIRNNQMTAEVLDDQCNPSGRGQYISRLQWWLLSGYVILLPIQIEHGHGLRLAPSDLFLAVLLCAIPLRLVRLRHNPQAWSVWHVGLVLSFIIASWISIISSGQLSRYALISKDAGLLILFAAYAVIAGSTDTWPRIRKLLQLLIASVAVQNAIFLLLFLSHRLTGIGIPGVDIGYDRLHGLLVDPNAYGGLLVLVLCVHMRTHHGLRPIFSQTTGWAITITIASGVMLTYSRSAWIALSVLLMLMLFSKPKLSLQLIIVSIVAGGLVLKILGSDYIVEMQRMAFRETAGDRVRLIQDAIPMFQQSPALGIGLGQFEARVGMIIHNTPVWMLFEFGLFGFVCFSGFMIWFLQRGLRAYRLLPKTHRPLVLGLITAHIAMLGLSLGIEAMYQRHWWLVLALIASSYSTARRGAATKRYRRAS